MQKINLYPNYSAIEERAKLMKAARVYDTVIKNIPVKSVNFLNGNKFDNCFEKYSFFKENYDFQSYLGRR